VTAATIPPTTAEARLRENSDRLIAQLGVAPGQIRGTTFDVTDPATGVTIARVPDMSPETALQAVAVAHTAGRDWATTPARHRADVLGQLHRAIVEHTEAFAVLITREMGKPLAEARTEVAYGADFVRWYAEQAVRPSGDFRDTPNGTARLFVSRAPVGLSVLITPWNFPLAMATRKIAPALAAGCPAILKPAAQTPLTALYLAELARGAGVPDDLLHVITTDDAPGFSSAVLADPRVRKVSFTGSTPVGRTLLRLAAGNVLKTSMELGGSAPLLVFDDADLERAIDGTVTAKLRNGGQSCIAANRILVQEGIADAFVEGLTERLQGIAVGNGFTAGVDLGPVIDDAAQHRLQSLVQDAAARGADILLDGSRVAGPGSFFGPTVMVAAPADSTVHHTEIFGPLAAITTFRTQEEAIEKANDSAFGLAGYVFTESLDRAFNVADQLETGLVGINQGVPSSAAAPFGGVKQSGLGREGSGEGLEEYQEVRYYNLARRSTR
jgi:succinate-semialdehyde dehydrogenase/glutarate-semialdehyde dehydrogenase